MVAAIIWFTFLLILITVISIRLFSEIFENQKEKRKFKTQNPFGTKFQERNTLNSREKLESEFGPNLAIIALSTSVMLWGMLYFLQQEFNNMLESIQRFKGLSIPTFIILFGFFGIAFMRKLLNDIGTENEFHDTENEDIINQRANSAVYTYLSFLLGALVFTFLSDISLKFNLIRFAPMSFIIGSSLYLLLRQNPKQRQAMTFFIKAMKKSKINNVNENQEHPSKKQKLDI